MQTFWDHIYIYMSCSAVGPFSCSAKSAISNHSESFTRSRNSFPPDARSLPCQVVNLAVLFLSTEGSTVKHIQDGRACALEQGTATVNQLRILGTALPWRLALLCWPSLGRLRKRKLQSLEASSNKVGEGDGNHCFGLSRTKMTSA